MANEQTSMVALSAALKLRASDRDDTLAQIGAQFRAAAARDQTPAIDFPMRLTERAHILHREQRDDQAMRCLEHALRLEPDMIAANAVKGDILLSHGDYLNG